MAAWAQGGPATLPAPPPPPQNQPSAGPTLAPPRSGSPTPMKVSGHRGGGGLWVWGGQRWSWLCPVPVVTSYQCPRVWDPDPLGQQLLGDEGGFGHHCAPQHPGHPRGPGLDPTVGVQGGQRGSCRAAQLQLRPGRLVSLVMMNPGRDIRVGAGDTVGTPGAALVKPSPRAPPMRWRLRPAEGAGAGRRCWRGALAAGPAGSLTGCQLAPGAPGGHGGTGTGSARG